MRAGAAAGAFGGRTGSPRRGEGRRAGGRRSLVGGGHPEGRRGAGPRPAAETPAFSGIGRTERLASESTSQAATADHRSSRRQKLPHEEVHAGAVIC